MEYQLEGVVRRALVRRGGSEEEAQRVQMDPCISLRVADMAEKVSLDKSEFDQHREMQHMITREANERLQKAEKLLIEGGARKVRDDSKEGGTTAASEESWVQI